MLPHSTARTARRFWLPRLGATRAAAPARLVAVLALTLAAARVALAGGGPAETVVLVNTASEESKKVAAAYVKARHIPPQQVCEVKCATGFDVPIADFVRDVVDPLRDFLRKRGLEDRVEFLVMTQGMPMRAATPGGHVSTSAALALVHTAHCGENQVPVQQGWRNPAYNGGLVAEIPRAIECGKFLNVTALFSNTTDEALSLIERSVASDGTAPAEALWIFQDANGNANTRNAAYDAARAQLDGLGGKSEHVPAGADKAVNRKRVIGYMAGGAYSALTADGVKTNEYLPGAICDHLQSFGAVPQNFDADPKNDSQFPISHMVRAGVTVVHGAVAEPYTIAFPDPDMFTAYAQGATAAEAFWRRFPLGYWMNLVLGDPLCAPYAKRPAVKLDTSGAEAKATAEGAVKVVLYVDGVQVAAADGETVTAALDPAALPPGLHHVLAEATGPGEWAPRGWTSATVTGKGPAPTSQPVARVAATQVEVVAPATAVAGEEVSIRVTPRDAASGPLPGWKGRIELRRSVPPVRLAKADAESVPDGGVVVPLRPTRSGDIEFTVTLPDDGVRQESRIRVVAGPPALATTPLLQVPLGQACDVDVVVLDAFGNRVEAFEGDVGIVLPGDPFAVVPSAVPMTKDHRGRLVFRDVVVTKGGRQALVITGGGKQFSQPKEAVEAVHTAVRAWLTSQPFRGEEAGKALAADPSAAADRDGALSSGKLWRRLRTPRDDVALPAQGTKDGDAVAAVAFVRTLNASKARLLVAGPGRIVVFLDGKQVFDGTPKMADPRGKREPVADVELSEGMHRLTVVAARKDKAPVFALEIDDGSGKHVDSVLVASAASADAPAKAVVSGRIGRGNRGVGGVKVALKVADGQELTATTAPDGTWFVEGVAAGDVVVTPTWQHPLSPASRTVHVEDGHVPDVDFAAEDKSPPTVQVAAPAAKFAKTLVLEPKVEDDDGIRELRLLLDGREEAKLTAAPWRFSVDVGIRTRGKHEIVVVATDPSGNEGKSAPVAVTLIDDTKGPAVKVAGLTNGAQLKKKAEVTATVTDDLPVASVQFRLDGKDVGAVRTAAPFTCEIDPTPLADGGHSLAVVAKDLDGNETLVEVKFKTKK